MKAIVVEQTGGPEVLKLKDVPDPSPAKGEAVVRHEFAGVNFIDVYHRTGLYQLALPFTPGSEAAGTVESVGPEVNDVKPGDRVAFAMVRGAYAEKIAAPASKLIKIPDWMSTKDAAAGMLQGLTVQYLVRGSYHIRAGDTVLIHAAAGGVGRMLVQAAKHLGAFVIGTTSTDEKAKIVKSAGADEVILYTKQDFREAVKSITKGSGVHAVYDSVGKTTFEPGLDCLRTRGIMVLFGQSSGPVPPFNPVLLARASLFLTRPALQYYTLTREELMERTAELFNWLQSGKVTLSIDSEFPLADAGNAHRRLESRASAGKILLSV